MKKLLILYVAVVLYVSWRLFVAIRDDHTYDPDDPMTREYLEREGRLVELDRLWQRRLTMSPGHRS